MVFQTPDWFPYRAFQYFIVSGLFTVIKAPLFLSRTLDQLICGSIAHQWLINSSPINRKSLINRNQAACAL